MATSYANLGGTGDRRRLIIVTSSGPSVAGTPSSLVDGDTSSTGRVFWSGSVSGSDTLRFDFGDSSYVIDEAKFYQSSATSQGTWQWEGSNDGSSWTSIGSSFTISNATETITSLSGNTTDYKQYRMLGVSGSMSGSPWLFQMEFKISPIVTKDNGLDTSYSYSGGMGDRSSGTVVVSAADNGGGFLSSTGTDTANLKTLVNGIFASTETDEQLANPTAASGYVQFDFGSSRIVDEANIWTGGNSGAFGTFKWRGSDNASVWTDIATGISFLVPSGGGGSSSARLQIFRELNSNTAAYRYLRLECTSGAATSLTGMTEFEFRISLLPTASVSDSATVGESLTDTTITHSSLSESVTVAESVSAFRFSSILTLSVSDSTTASDPIIATPDSPKSASTSDSILVTEILSFTGDTPTRTAAVRTTINQTTVSASIPTPINLTAMDTTTASTTLAAAAINSQAFLLLTSLSGLISGDYLLLTGAERVLTTALNDGSTIASSVVNAGGTTYVVGNTGTITNVGAGVVATYVVDSVSGGAVLTYHITNLSTAYGYTTANGVTTTATTGSGTGFTIDMVANSGHAVSVARGQAGTAATSHSSGATVVDISLGNEVVSPSVQTVLLFQNTDTVAHLVTVYSPSGSASYTIQAGGFLTLGRVALLSLAQPSNGRIWINGSDSTVKVAALQVA